MADPLKPKPFQPEDKSLSKKKTAKKSPSPLPNKKSNGNSAIPKEVANRMARRIAITTGLPTFSGMSVFVISYLIVSKGIADISPALTLLTSAICFLVGLLGLSYGILSASWENSPGTFLGLENIRPNIVRVKAAFSSMNQKN